MIRDAWGGPLRIACNDSQVCVYSAGQNRNDEHGGGDDIKSCAKR